MYKRMFFRIKYNIIFGKHNLSNSNMAVTYDQDYPHHLDSTLESLLIERVIGQVKSTYPLISPRENNTIGAQWINHDDVSITHNESYASVLEINGVYLLRFLVEPATFHGKEDLVKLFGKTYNHEEYIGGSHKARSREIVFKIVNSWATLLTMVLLNQGQGGHVSVRVQSRYIVESKIHDVLIIAE